MCFVWMAVLISSVRVFACILRSCLCCLWQCYSPTVVAQRSQLPAVSGTRRSTVASGVSVVGDFQQELMTPEGKQESHGFARWCTPVWFEPVLLPLPCSCLTPLRWRTPSAGGQPGLSASPAEGPSLALCCSCCRSAVWMSPVLEESSCVWGRSLHRKRLAQVRCESAEESKIN